MNCPFYGRHMFLPQPGMLKRRPFLLIGQDGNQCAICLDAYTPCWMEQNQLPVDWQECPLVKDLRMETHN